MHDFPDQFLTCTSAATSMISDKLGAHLLIGLPALPARTRQNKQ